MRAQHHPGRLRALSRRAGLGLLAAAVALPVGAGAAGAASSTDQASPVPHRGLGLVFPSATVAARSSVAASRTVGAAPRTLGTAPQPSVDLRTSGFLPAVGDQGQIGSCATWTIAHTIMGYYAAKTSAAGAPFNALHLWETQTGGTNPNTGTAAIYDLDQAKVYGVDTEADYWQGWYDYADHPTSAETANATQYKITGYTTLWQNGTPSGDTKQDLLEQALSAGNPVAVGFTVHKSFMDASHLSDETAVDPESGSSLGGHMVTAVGYDSTGLILRNQWGTGWGHGGDIKVTWGWVQNEIVEAYTVSGVTTTNTAPAPNVVSMSTSGGPLAGGTQVTVKGSNLGSATAVTVGGVAATGLTTATTTGATTLTFTTPAGTASGAASVLVTGPGGTSTSSGAATFTYGGSSSGNTQVTAADATATYGTAFSVPVTVTTTSSSALAGTVTATEGGKKLSVATLKNGAATLKVSGLAVGTHTVALAFTPTTSKAHPTTLDAAATTLTLTVSPLTSTVTGTPSTGITIASPGTLAVRVAAKGVTPTGTVTATEGGASIGTGTLKNGSAVLVLPTLTLGAHTLTLTYSGDTKAGTATGSATVNAAAKPVSAVTAPAATTTTDKQATLAVTATVLKKATSGTITATDSDGTSLGSGALTTSGRVSIQLPKLSAGTHTITLTHTGAPATATGGTGTVYVTVTAARPTLATTLGATSVITGSGTTVAVAVSSPAGTATGTVTLKEGTTALDTQTLTSGSATLTVPTSLAVGRHVLTVVYSGSSELVSVSKAVGTLTVTKAS